MHPSRITLMFVAAAVAGALPLAAQQKRISPHETISKVIDGNRITVIYGRPYTKDPKTGEMRTIWGGLVPYGKVWRTGLMGHSCRRKNVFLFLTALETVLKTEGFKARPGAIEAATAVYASA